MKICGKCFCVCVFFFLFNVGRILKALDIVSRKSTL